MKYQEIFDRNIINKLQALDKFANPSVVFLCQSGEPSLDVFRMQIERWFQNLPSNQKADMYQRLRSLDDRQHLGAFYELLFHQYSLEENWKISKHAKINGVTPDFFIEVPEGAISFYMEVATLMDDERLRQNEGRFNKLLRKINAINTKFIVSVHLKKWLSVDVKYDKIVQAADKWLNTLSKSDKVHYKVEINEFGFNGSFDASYYENAKMKSGCVFAWSPPGNFGNYGINQIKAAIGDKVKKYKFIKRSGKPFVIAMCGGGSYSLDEIAIDRALYGNILISWEENNPHSETMVHRDHSGLLTPKPGLFGQPRNTRVSAIIFCSRIRDKERMLYNIRVFHNPWASTKLPLEVFSKMPQLAEDRKKDSRHIRLKWQNDKKQLIAFD